ncbi:hypothetical protein Avbf_17774 [Armadillidium vulgare]|nr:hypothetical protein Avbf_17774 [Armadillidium vulgare]
MYNEEIGINYQPPTVVSSGNFVKLNREYLILMIKLPKSLKYLSMFRASRQGIKEHITSRMD